MKTIRSILLMLVFGAASMARATDFTDLWWNASENGWGVNVAHQDNILFMTFFLYAPNNQPVWYSASSVTFQGPDSQSNLVYTGKLYQTTGPYFGTVPYNQATVVATEVGTVTFTAKSADTATLAYTVNGVSVVKDIIRLTFRGNPNVNGNYLGGFIGDVSSCGANNGHFELSVVVNVTGTPATQQMVIAPSAGSCTITGPYTAPGRMGRIQGTIACGTLTGTVAVFEIEADLLHLSAGYQATYSDGCKETGRFGGMRR